MATLSSWAAAVIATIRRVPLGARVTHVEGVLAMLVTLAMTVVAAGTLVWWGSIASVAPTFFAAAPRGTAALPFAPELVTIAAMTVAGTAGGLAGVVRIARAAS